MILNQAAPFAGRRARRALLLVSATALVLGVATAFGSASTAAVFDGHFERNLRDLGIPDIHPLTATTDVHTRVLRIERGDSVSGILSDLGVDENGISALLSDNKEAQAVARQLIPGKTLTARITPDGNIRSLTFPPSGDTGSTLFIQQGPTGLDARVIAPKVDSRIALQTAVIRHSLFGATDEAGIPDSVAIQLADIFGGDIDFHRDLRKGDRFSVIYESASYQGKALQAQRVLAAEFVNDGKVYRAFWYDNGHGTAGYYTADGKNVKKAFLRSPLEFSRISSGFTNARLHPILQKIRAHRGIDYAAPVGTHVKTTGDGIVEFVGVRGGYGKVIVVRHAGDKSTLYGHLSGFAPGIRIGKRVAQGDVIGYVGATGLATGPHLHYEFRIAGIHRNPLTLALPAAPPLPATEISAFRDQVNQQLSMISDIRDMRMALLD